LDHYLCYVTCTWTLNSVRNNKNWHLRKKYHYEIKVKKSLEENQIFCSKVKMKTIEQTDGALSVIGKLVKQLFLTSLFLVLSRYLLTAIISTLLGVEDPWQHLWDRVIDRFGDDPFTYHVYGSILVINISTVVWDWWPTLLLILSNIKTNKTIIWKILACIEWVP